MTYKTTHQLISDNLLVKHYAGSISYGTNLPTSDVDYRGIFCADPINIRTPFYVVREVVDSSEEDTKFHELTHFMKLCLDCNPNIIETLWVDDKHITYRTPAYDLLRDHRHRLLSSKIAFTTTGYAISQLKRIKGHKKWINNPQSVEQPRQQDYVSLVQWFGSDKVLPRDFDITGYHKNHRLVPYGSDTYGMYPDTGCNAINDDGSLKHNVDCDRELLPHPIAIVRFNQQQWQQACDTHRNYWNWKTNRNQQRSELEEKHGFDSKHAMHLVRLMKMSVEALRDEEIVVNRPDAKELLDIRNGSLTYDELLQYAEDMDKQVREIWYKKTNLPKKPDIKFAAQLLMDVQDIVWASTNN